MTPRDSTALLLGYQESIWSILLTLFYLHVLYNCLLLYYPNARYQIDPAL